MTTIEPNILELLELPLWTGFGSFALYMLNRMQDKQPFSLFRAVNIDVLSADARPFYIFLDMILSSFIAAALVFPLASPTTIPQAIIAGLGVTGLLSTYTKEAR